MPLKVAHLYFSHVQVRASVQKNNYEEEEKHHVSKYMSKAQQDYAVEKDEVMQIIERINKGEEEEEIQKISLALPDPQELSNLINDEVRRQLNSEDTISTFAGNMMSPGEISRMIEQSVREETKRLDTERREREEMEQLAAGTPPKSKKKAGEKGYQAKPASEPADEGNRFQDWSRRDLVKTIVQMQRDQELLHRRLRDMDFKLNEVTKLATQYAEKLSIERARNQHLERNEFAFSAGAEWPARHSINGRVSATAPASAAAWTPDLLGGIGRIDNIGRTWRTSDLDSSGSLSPATSLSPKSPATPASEASAALSSRTSSGPATPLASDRSLPKSQPEISPLSSSWSPVRSPQLDTSDMAPTPASEFAKRGDCRCLIFHCPTYRSAWKTPPTQTMTAERLHFMTWTRIAMNREPEQVWTHPMTIRQLS